MTLIDAKFDADFINISEVTSRKTKWRRFFGPPCIVYHSVAELGTPSITWDKNFAAVYLENRPGVRNGDSRIQIQLKEDGGGVSRRNLMEKSALGTTRHQVKSCPATATDHAHCTLIGQYFDVVDGTACLCYYFMLLLDAFSSCAH